jgi:glycosyltransferase involved in cell wall biosynthesis
MELPMGLPKVAILLATYNGQRFLPKQLDSLIGQTYPNWQIFASDDNSTDDTMDILGIYKNKLGDHQLTITSGPRLGFAVNFLSMVHNTAINADYYAYADQDDIWEADKLQRAIDWLSTVPQDIPSLYCSRTRLIDEHDNRMGHSPLFTRTPSFANALVQNIGGGNTMVFNQAARDIIGQITPANIVSHDWLTYLAVTGCGGRVYYDSQPFINYRQHKSNLVGTNSSWCSRLVRIKMLFAGRFRLWNECNISALEFINSRLTPKNQLIFRQFLITRQGWLIPRLINFFRSGIYRQTLLGNMGLIAAVVFNKI